MSADGPKQEPQEDELLMPLQARRLPAVYCDTYFLTYWEDRVRISFAERLEDGTYYRSAVVLPMNTVNALSKSLAEIVAEETADQSAKK